MNFSILVCIADTFLFLTKDQIDPCAVSSRRRCKQIFHDNPLPVMPLKKARITDSGDYGYYEEIGLPRLKANSGMYQIGVSEAIVVISDLLGRIVRLSLRKAQAPPAQSAFLELAPG